MTDVSRLRRLVALLKHSPPISFCVRVLLLALIAIFPLWLHTVYPAQINPRLRLWAPSEAFWLGSDAAGRDVWSRLVYGTRVSLIVGTLVAMLALVVGTCLGLAAGMIASLDGLLMQTMDGLMAILAISLPSLFSVPLVPTSSPSVSRARSEIARVARLVRIVVLTVNSETYIEAATTVGTRLPKLVWVHVLPNIMAPLIVQGTYIASSAILIEASLSFLGIGLSNETPSWGNIMADARIYFQLAPWLIFAPGLCIGLTVMWVNRLGDVLRDLLDPRLAKSVGGLS